MAQVQIKQELSETEIDHKELAARLAMQENVAAISTVTGQLSPATVAMTTAMRMPLANGVLATPQGLVSTSVAGSPVLVVPQFPPQLMQQFVQARFPMVATTTAQPPTVEPTAKQPENGTTYEALDLSKQKISKPETTVPVPESGAETDVAVMIGQPQVAMETEQEEGLEVGEGGKGKDKGRQGQGGGGENNNVANIGHDNRFLMSESPL